MSIDNKTFCDRPFASVYSAPGENYKPCCWAKRELFDKNAYDCTPLEFFEGDVMKKIRTDILSGKDTEFLKDVCWFCRYQEEHYKVSPRSLFPDKTTTNNFDENGNCTWENRFLHVSINIYGNYCNLECYMCYSNRSSSRNAALKKIDPELHKNEGLQISEVIDPKKSKVNNYNTRSGIYHAIDSDVKKIDPEYFDKIIDELIEKSPNIKSISITGGEPMLMKSHFIFLDKLIECGESKNISILFITNMTLMDPDFMYENYFKKFKDVDVEWSIEALRERDEWIRYPTKWDVALKNVRRLKSIMKNGIVQGSITPSLLGVLTIHHTVKWLYINKLISKNFTLYHTIRDPDILDPRHLPDEIKNNLIPIFERCNMDKIANQLRLSRDENKFQEAIKYFDELDKSRGTNWRKIFPELSNY